MVQKISPQKAVVAVEVPTRPEQEAVVEDRLMKMEVAGVEGPKKPVQEAEVVVQTLMEAVVVVLVRLEEQAVVVVQMLSQSLYATTVEFQVL